jgi:hypothetical protein
MDDDLVEPAVVMPPPKHMAHHTMLWRAGSKLRETQIWDEREQRLRITVLSTTSRDFSGMARFT